jgi:hypothetical protein
MRTWLIALSLLVAPGVFANKTGTRTIAQKRIVTTGDAEKMLSVHSTEADSKGKRAKPRISLGTPAKGTEMLGVWSIVRTSHGRQLERNMEFFDGKWRTVDKKRVALPPGASENTTTSVKTETHMTRAGTGAIIDTLTTTEKRDRN